MKNEIKTIEIFDTVETFKNQTAIEKKECFFILSANELKYGLQKIKPVINKNHCIPICETVKFEIVEGRVKLTANDMENIISVNLPAETKGTGEICIPYSTLSNYIATIPDGNLLFTIDFNNFTLVIKRDNSIFKITGFNPAEFPVMPA